MFRYLSKAIKNISAPELLSFSLNIAAYILCGNVQQHLYLWAIIFACDVMVLCSHGAWLEAGGNRIYGPWRTPTPHVVRFVATTTLFLTARKQQQDVVLDTFIWYAITVTAVCHAFFCILQTMQQIDKRWLAGTEGRIGTPNWISIIRMAIAVLIPHLYVVEPFGKASSWLGATALVLAIATDAADGYVARKTHQVTKAGKTLDPLCDKVIFYPMAIAYWIVSDGTVFLAADTRKVFMFCAGVTIGRDILYFLWFFINRKKVGSVIGAGAVDKVRMAAMCTWLGCSALALTFTELRSRLAAAGFACAVIIAMLSIISIAVDRERIAVASTR